MALLSRTQMIVAVGAVLLALYVLDLVRRRRLSEEYSLLWVLSTVAIAVLGFSTPLLGRVTRALGPPGESATVFALGLAFVTAILLHFSVRLSRLDRENQVLTRELALMRYELEGLRGGRPAGSASGPGAAERG